ncbi:anaphase promoting complex subunit 5 [Mortierella alpina]|nr:anaphase promoting complex subunit 5 [Mortierella alpina]
MSRRAYARTATDISLLPPQTQSFSPAEQNVAASADATSSQDAQARLDALGHSAGPIHVVPYLTPHKVAILILLEYLCQSQCPQESAQSLMLFLLKCIQDPAEYLHRDVNEFGALVTSTVGPHAWNHLRATLKRIKSPHHLSDFFLSKLEQEDTTPRDVSLRRIGLANLVLPRGDIMSDGMNFRLDSASIMGLYVRKAQIEYKRLLFEDMCRFFTAFLTYVSALDRHPSTKEPPSETPEELSVMSVFDLEKFLDLQAEQLSNVSQSEIPDALLAHVYSIQSRMPALPKTHYIACLHAQQTGNFEVAIQSLHRFFDYCMSLDGRVLHQYALLNLAILHARFSHHDQALIALRETIEVARNHMDEECLSYALKYETRIANEGTTSSKRSGASEVQLLANLAGKSEGQACQYLHSLSELTIAKQMQGESIAKALEALVKASSINLRHSLDSIGGVAQLFQSRIWSTYGTPSLSSLYAQLQLQYHPTETDMSDAASGYSKHASDLALTGRYKEALEVIEAAKAKFPLRTMKATPWVQTLVQVLQRRAMSMNQLRDVELWNQQLATTLVNTSILAMNPETGESAQAGEKRGGLHTYDNQVDGTSLEMQLDILLQKALLSVLVGHAQAGVQQLSEGLTLIRRNQWHGTHKFTIIQGDLFVQALAYFQGAKCLFARLNRAASSLETPQEGQEMPSQGRSSSRQQGLRRVVGLLQHALESFERLESLRDVVQVLYFQARAYRELCMDDALEKTLAQFKATSLKVAERKNQHEPSWYSYYYTRDAFNGILRSDDGAADLRNISGQTKSTALSSQGRGRVAGGGLQRAGSTHWSSNSGSGLKRTPSQLWQSVVAPARPPSLPTHAEGQGQAALSTDAQIRNEDEEEDDEDGEVDMAAEGGHRPGPDDLDTGPDHSKRRRVARK